MRQTVILAITLILTACMGEDPAQTIRLSGKTMGTVYNIVAVGIPEGVTESALAGDVEAVLASVNAKMSNWDPKSEVSRFNASASTAPTQISNDFLTVMTAASEVHNRSAGKFDVTLGPLIDLWGFGPRKPEDAPPSEADIQHALQFVGQGQVLNLDASVPALSKTAPQVGINLSALAKGFGIDAVAQKLKTLGIDNYMVEIGGDLITAGQNEKGEAWRIGIEKPEPGEKSIELIVPLENKGLATSGDYRNFIEHEGVRYSHIVDPVTGRPITHRTTSVSVIADSAMMADAWATAMLVLGEKRGLEIAEANKLAVYFISRGENDGAVSYVTKASSAFDALRKPK